MRRCIVVALIGLIVPNVLGAQVIASSEKSAGPPPSTAAQSSARAPAPVPDPAYAVSRFEEIWSATPSPRGERILKHLALRDDGASWLTLAGSVRARESSYGNFLLSDAAAMQDSYAELRTLLSADLWLGRASAPHARLFAEVRDAQGFGRTLPGGVRTNEADRTDWQNLFADIAYGGNGVRYGRQELALGRERLVGVGDWANSRRAFEGVKGMARLQGMRVELFDGRVVAVRTDAPDRPDSTTHFRVVSVATLRDRAASRSLLPSAWQGWVMRLQSDRGASSRTTVGARALWKVPAGSSLFTLELEGASQRGHIRAKAVDAWFSVAEGTVVWKRARWSPSALLGLDVGSGTASDTLHRADAFQPPYATAHGFTGIADVFGRGNLAEARGGFGFEPRRGVQVQGVWRHFTRVRTEDGVYNKSNALLRAAAGSRDRAVGDEGDVTVTWPVGSHLKVQGGAALVLPGSFLRNAAAGAVAERFVFVSTTVTF